MKRTITSFQYHIYTTFQCSLSCSHCFVDEDLRNQKSSMTVEQVKHLADVYSKHFAESDVEKAEITIIGGEPTMLSHSFYDEVMPYLRTKFEKTGKFFYISIMTNLLHSSNLEKMWHHFDLITTSFEPNRFTSLNNVANPEKKGDVWLRNLKEWVKKDRPISISIATTKDVLDAGIGLFDELYSIGIKRFQLNPAIPEGEFIKNIINDDSYRIFNEKRRESMISPARRRPVINIINENSLFSNYKQESEYMIEATKWLADKIKKGHSVDIYPIQSSLVSIINNQVIDDIACGVDKGLNTRPDGEVSGCSAEMGSKNMVSYGNMWTETLDEIDNSLTKKAYIQSTKQCKSSCISCEFFINCKGGCSLRSRLWNERDPEQECHGLKSYLLYLKDNSLELSEVLLSKDNLFNEQE